MSPRNMLSSGVSYSSFPGHKLHNTSIKSGYELTHTFYHFRKKGNTWEMLPYLNKVMLFPCDFFVTTNYFQTIRCSDFIQIMWVN